MSPRKLHRPLIVAALLALGGPAGQAADHGPVKSVSRVDAQRFAGTWYELARLPNRFQADCASDVTAHYLPQQDGTLQVTNSCRTPTGRVETDVGRAWPVTKQSSDNASKLKVSFMPKWLQWLPVGKGDFWVVMLDPSYRWAVVSEPKRQHLWVLSRTPTLPPDQLGRIVDRLRAEGYPAEQLVLTRQSAPNPQQLPRPSHTSQTSPTSPTSLASPMPQSSPSPQHQESPPPLLVDDYRGDHEA